MAKGEKLQSVVLFGQRLKKLREAADISQEQIHYATGITQMHISRIESGDINTSIGKASKLASFFGLEDYEMFFYNQNIPAGDFLQKNIAKFLIRNNIDPKIFLKKGLTNILTKELQSKFFNTPKYAVEISEMLEEKHNVKFSTARISDAMNDFKKKGLIEKLSTDKKSKFQYRKK